MKIRKLVQASEVVLDEQATEGCSISTQEDYNSAIDCIECAIKSLSHAAHCSSDNVVAKESIANLAVVMFDLKAQLEPVADVALVPKELDAVVEEEGL